MKKRELISLALSLIIVLVLGSGVLAEGYDGSIAWTGQGADNDPACEKVGDGPRTSDGWIHWIPDSVGWCECC